MSGAQSRASTAEATGAILLAAGASSRMGFDKIWADLAGLPLIAHPLQVLSRSRAVGRIVVVARSDQLERMRDLLDRLGLEGDVVSGGDRRQDSVRAGLDALQGVEWIVVHDGARPLVTTALVEQGLAAARETGAAIAAVPTTDTIKVVAERLVVSTPPRESLWSAQTPQVFRRSVLVRAHEQELLATDDAALVEALGVPVRVFEGAYGNIKVTSEADLQFARLLLQMMESGSPGQETSLVQAGAHLDER